MPNSLQSCSRAPPSQQQQAPVSQPMYPGRYSRYGPSSRYPPERPLERPYGRPYPDPYERRQPMSGPPPSRDEYYYYRRPPIHSDAYLDYSTPAYTRRPVLDYN